MAQGNDSADKNELPTPKKLRDARKKGDVAKSKDLGTGLLTLAWMILFLAVSGYAASQLATLASETISGATSLPFDTAATTIGWSAATTLLRITLATLVPVAVLATLTEFLQVGPMVTVEKMKFGLEKMNPVEGLKRMFGKDGLFELVKTLIKAGLICAIIYLTFRSALEGAGQLVRLAGSSPIDNSGQVAAMAVLSQTYSLTVQMLAMVVAVFLFVAVADRIYAKHSFIKKMKMSRRDIKQEHKEDEGDPQVKSMRREMHQEWANQNTMGATRGSAALLVNPTHIAIALDYDQETCPVPVIAAKGMGDVAAAMREEAERAGVPIIRNIQTARTLWARGEIGEIVPEDLFDAIAAVILWAAKARSGEAPMWHDMDGPALRAPALN
ncbi:EscU/YscU/HrcU family type III secretion system export apparatus switch protein [Allosphingosinicella deserti]|uniref:EscU/YscU/HrcU family type III secretion system export apparatus switch protein n=1 Tax=Allosphingosinicella deserti TaxID=2116704 RepID=A0A2P7QZU3_9SPHN|nr:EscU/YscU/HrcU family type III secretion system export apparatus switch protein [Sphingomonas deserti]PSJ43492.1 EscU/YscU/HrcU family type III secretion system export apparatus switch protein [Sphingomonas deserti]